MENAVLKAQRVNGTSLPNLNQYRTDVRAWHVTSSANQIHITATVDYMVNARNSFTVAYVSDVNTDGSLTTKYEIDPKVEAKFLPHIEIDLRLIPQLSRMRWLGLGQSTLTQMRAPQVSLGCGQPGKVQPMQMV